METQKHNQRTDDFLGEGAEVGERNQDQEQDHADAQTNQQDDEDHHDSAEIVHQGQEKVGERWTSNCTSRAGQDSYPVLSKENTPDMLSKRSQKFILKMTRLRDQAIIIPCASIAPTTQ